MRNLDPQSLTKHVDRLFRAAWSLCGSREDELYYLMRVLRNTFLTSRRTAGRRPVTVATLEDVAAADPSPIGRPEHALEMKEVYATIAALPEDFRLALVAVDVLGLSYREAARALRVREATITTRLFRARKQVTAKLVPPEAPARRATPAPPERRPGESLPADAAETRGSPQPTPEIPPSRREEKQPRGVLEGRGSQ
jgi:RNA polymerase sigma-70 factor (ECF subfamily)